MLAIDYHIHSNYSDGKASLNDIITVAVEKGIKQLIFTDHMNVLGNFLYSFRDPPKSLHQFYTEFTRLQKKYSNIIEIYMGAEITADFIKIPKSAKQEDILQEYLQEFSLFLIETYVIQEPIITALNMRKFLNDLGFSYIPVILAHPYYSSMEFSTFHKLLHLNIGFELNEDKITPREASFFLDHVHKLAPQEKSKLMLSIGSDSHNIDNVGSVSFAAKVVSENNLWKYVIKPPKIKNIRIL